MYYLLADQLGSTSITTDANGAKIAELRYDAWGEVRYSSGSSPSHYSYTGQYSDSYINLLDYGSRLYDPELGRFIQPDSIVPDPSNPQSYDRYAFVYNNPLRYTDPDGHDPIPYGQFIMQAIAFFASKTYQVIGDPTTKSIFANGADLVFTRGKEALAVELKNIADGNVNLGTLGYSLKGEDYGGSISRIVRSASRFIDSSNQQLSMESQAIKTAAEEGNLTNALYTNAQGASEEVQNLFNGVYTNAEEDAADAVKALPGALAAGKTLLQGAGEEVNGFAPIVIPRILIDPFINPYFRHSRPTITSYYRRGTTIRSF